MTMNIDERMRIDGVKGPDPAHHAGKPEQTGPTEFRRLLEKLEAVAKQSKVEESVEDVDKLRDAMKQADDDFSVVMDLRKKLEDAYRRSQS
ncbi:MAG: hypothetical protein KDB80_15935 [Planctomycetes bacterium]|nr:hypothetical protein [Planctomycetota bacterium]